MPIRYRAVAYCGNVFSKRTNTGYACYCLHAYCDWCLGETLSHCCANIATSFFAYSGSSSGLGTVLSKLGRMVGYYGGAFRNPHRCYTLCKIFSNDVNMGGGAWSES